MCKCGGCGEHFNSLYCFDKHRTGPFNDRRCLTPFEMEAKGYSKNAFGRWITQAQVRVRS